MSDVALEGFEAPKDNWLDPLPKLGLEGPGRANARSDLGHDLGDLVGAVGVVAWVRAFMACYEQHLRAGIVAVNKNSVAIRGACRALKIKHTYRDIDAYLKGTS